MTPSDLEAAVLESLRAYWRIKAALALHKAYSTHDALGIDTIDYESVPQHGVATAFLHNETVTQATGAIAKYVDERLSCDFFLSLIAHFESFLSDVLIRAGQSPSGTFGALQRAVEQIHTIPPNVVEDCDEIRERRNALIHHQGRVGAGSRYETAAAKVFPRAPGMVPDPAAVTVIGVPPQYLSYVADVVVRYGRAIP